VAALTDATVQFGLVPADHWTQPPWINETKASAARESMANNGVIYGGASSTLVCRMSVDTQNNDRESSVRVILIMVEIGCSTFLDIGICVDSTLEYAFNVLQKSACTELVYL
jgi:Glycolipid 2-alpha-mannosyltransferase